MLFAHETFAEGEVAGRREETVFRVEQSEASFILLFSKCCPWYHVPP